MADQPTEIENIRWTLTEMNGQPLPPSVVGKAYILLSQEDHRVSGFTGCNRLMGSYEMPNPLQLRFSKMATTRMACLGLGWDEYEFTQILEKVNNYTINGDRLDLNIGKRAPLATFRKVRKEDIDNKYWKLTELDGKKVTMADNQEREQYMILRSDGSVVGFGGCNQFSGRFEQENGWKIKFSNMLSTLRACEDLDINEAFYMGAIENASRFEVENDVLILKSDTGKKLAVFEAIYF